MKLIKTTRQIYAYRTPVTRGKSIDEVRGILRKFGCKGFQLTEVPDGSAYIRFLMPTPVGNIPVHVDIPEIRIRQKKGTKYLEKESYRALVLILKAKFNLVELGEPIQEVFFLNAVTPDGHLLKEKMMSDLPLLTQGRSPNK